MATEVEEIHEELNKTIEKLYEGIKQKEIPKESIVEEMIDMEKLMKTRDLFKNEVFISKENKHKFKFIKQYYLNVFEKYLEDNFFVELMMISYYFTFQKGEITEDEIVEELKKFIKLNIYKKEEILKITNHEFNHLIFSTMRVSTATAIQNWVRLIYEELD